MMAMMVMMVMKVMKMTKMLNFQGKPLDILLLQSTKGKVCDYILYHE